MSDLAEQARYYSQRHLSTAWQSELFVKLADALEAKDAEIERLRAALRESCDEDRQRDYGGCPLSDEIESLRDRLSEMWTDIAGWVQLAERQYDEMDNASHNPLAPTKAAIEASRKILFVNGKQTKRGD